MELFKKISWEHQGKEYDFRVLFENNLINILAFFNNHPANGFRYQIHLPKNTDIRKLLNIENLNHLIEYAKDDIKMERWKLFSE